MHSMKVLGGWTAVLLGALVFVAAPARAADAAGVALPSADEGVRLVTVIAADIDADGDLDVVATDGLQLHVWVNDGRGHFTKRAPARPTTWEVTPAAPVFDGGPAAPQSAMQLDPPPPGGGRRAVPGTLRGAADRVPSVRSDVRTPDLLLLVPRAPPRAA